MLLQSMLCVIIAWLLISHLTLALFFSRIKPALIRFNSTSSRSDHTLR
jgi:hypothetical protein